MKLTTGEMDKVNDSGHGGHESDSDLPESPGSRATNKQVIDLLETVIIWTKTGY